MFRLNLIVRQCLLKWLCRDYESTEFWKTEARRFFFATVRHPDGNSDSDKARKNLADFLKSMFFAFDPKELAVKKWKKDFSDIENVVIPPPSNPPDKVNWDWIADYFLLCVHETCDDLTELNSSRTEFNNKLRMRTSANIKRIEVFHNIVQKYLIDAIVSLSPKDKNEEKETKQLKSRPKLIEEESGSGNELKEIALTVVSPYQSKYFNQTEGN